MNRKIAVLLIGAGLLLGLSPTAHTGEEHGEVTVTGEVLDMSCYLAKGAKGKGHAECAKACVKGGQPMGLLADDGTVYLLVASHTSTEAFDAAKKHAGEKVEVKGVTADRDGIKMIEVQSVKGM